MKHFAHALHLLMKESMRIEEETKSVKKKDENSKRNEQCPVVGYLKDTELNNKTK